MYLCIRYQRERYDQLLVMFMQHNITITNREGVIGEGEEMHKCIKDRISSIMGEKGGG